MRVGVAGLGKMGSIFAERLLAARHEVAVWNRTAAKAERLASENGAKACATPADLVGAADLIITMVADAPALADVFEGAEGLLSVDCSGTLFVEMSTVLPRTHIDLEKSIEAKGGKLLECPVGGSVNVARDGRLLGFAGGSTEDLERARPVVEHLCRQVDHAGPMGAGAGLKLAINLPLAIYWQSLGEALALCERFDYDPEFLMGVIGESSGGPNVLKVRGPAIVRTLKGEDVPVTADLATIRKDLGLMLEEARHNGHASPLVEQTMASFDRAIERGLGGIDCSAFPAYWARKGAGAA